MSKTFYYNSPLETKGLIKKDKSLKIAGYANTTDKDRSGDVIPATAWAKGVDNYRKNPVLLYQHDHAKPIGRVDNITVDKKGIYVEAAVSQAAEKLHGVQTLIEDGALKSFSVGFRVKDGDYDRDSDTMKITDVELLEISVVSVPCNQESLFSVSKSFDDDTEYKKFKEQFAKNNEEKKADDVSVGVTAYVGGHYHTAEVDKDGNGVTTYTSHGEKHFHEVRYYNLIEAQKPTSHTHEMVFMVKPSEMQNEVMEEQRPLSPSEAMGNGSMNLLTESENRKGDEEMSDNSVTEEELTETSGVSVEDAITESEEVTVTLSTSSEADDMEKEEIEDDEDEAISADPYEPIPFVNLLSTETSRLTHDDFVKYQNKRWKVVKLATAQNPFYQFLEVDLNGKSLDNSVDVDAKTLSVVNNWDLGTKFDITLTEVSTKTFTDRDRVEIKDTFNHLVTLSEQELYDLKSKVNTEDDQEKLNKTINLKITPSDEWTDTNYQVANHMINQIQELNEIKSGEVEEKDLALMLHGHKTINSKENETMATQDVGDPIVVKNEAQTEAPAEATPVVEEKSAPAVVSEPRVAELVEKTGEAILSEADAQDKKGEYTPTETEQVAELKAQMKKYEEQISALSQSKMVYQETSHTSKEQFSTKDMTNAYMLATALGRRDPFDTKMGQKIKAVTSVDQFLSNFSSNVYEEMEQQLVIAPMFDRLQVDAKTFRIPVAKEDTDGDVAQFASGTFATGIADATNVPTTNQNTIGAVELTPHKFMATTHLAKDEEEDTVLPLMDFLRRAATRRLARAIDKGILRGTGALSGFTASPTNAITAGAGYASVIKGVATLADDISGLRTTTGGGNDKADASDIASARAKMGKYGLQLGDHLVYVTSVEGYNELVSFSDFRTVDKFGPNATYLTGAVGAIYGIPIVISEFMDNVGSTGNELGVLVYKPGFIIAERRGMEIESEYEPRQQVTAMYMSTRFDFKALSSNSNAALDATNFAYASLIEAG
tara:strand:+ start:5950 stop:8946 length:2997 start_codon:yes stop_codon:yes gene_type:complete